MIIQREEMQNAIDRCKVDFEDRVENDNISMVGKYDIESLQMYLDQEEALKGGQTISRAIEQHKSYF